MLAIVLFAGTAQAQDTARHRDHKGKKEMVSKKLNLSEDQKAKIKAINEARKSEIQSLNNTALTADQRKEKMKELHQKYQAEFDQRIAQIEAYDEHLTDLKGRIEANRKELDIREKDLRNKRSQLDLYLAQSRIDEYNAAVPGFNAGVVSYRNMVDQTNSMVDEFNRTLADRNALAVQERQLEAAIDSKVDSAPKQ